MYEPKIREVRNSIGTGAAVYFFPGVNSGGPDGWLQVGRRESRARSRKGIYGMLDGYCKGKGVQILGENEK